MRDHPDTPSTRGLVIATRGSKLALWQAEHVKALILAARPEVPAVSLLVLKTKGDKILDVPLAKVGGKGLFVKEIEEALLDGRADLAVHSMKDMPMELPPELTLGAIMEREDPRDIFLSVRHASLDALPKGARVGTSSLRRAAQLLALRPDLEIIPLRGNVDTRLAKLTAGEFDAIIMAAAGMKRLGLAAPHMEELPETVLLPAAGQGALGVEYRKDRRDLAEALAFLDHEKTHACVMAERGYLAGLDGGCQAPMAAHAVIRGGTLTLETLLCDLTGKRMFRETAELDASLGGDAAYRAGRKLAETVKRSGGESLLAEIFAATNA
ncbi:hydroxymethylbilane synthase [uncultured delta proteobacterium]|uniref:Porphobilinogen deaminase n=1 Tax=uncultured delta proteobacterium TaxID=34034 RepID=A0A212J9L6_9DELT|nr:hydroxymethylbilane synthase [uncultured delta proteobacterium]